VHPRATEIETPYSAATARGDPTPQYTPKSGNKRQTRPRRSARTLPPEATAAGATLAPWFRCGWLVRRSLRVF